MKTRKGNWSFVKVPTYPVINKEDRLYWRNLAERILKIGIEFEMNLPDRKGTCRGKNIFCACLHISEGCWKECTKTKTCESLPYKDLCLKHITGRCKGNAEKGCTECNDFEFKCLSIDCIDFSSQCHVCKNRTISCDLCPEKYDPERDPGKIRKNLITKFKPTQSFSLAGLHGVWNITHDGSLKGDGGLEVITVGRKFQFQAFYKMIKEIIDATTSSGAYLDERCGIHMHVLNGYYEGGGTELENAMPPIILANIIQLVRRYHPALVWLTSAGNSSGHLTRWEKFRLNMLEYSPLMKDLATLRNSMGTESRNHGNSKYHFVNIQKTEFNGKGDISTLHLEFRFPDSVNCPIIITSQAAMFQAIVLKAIDFSQYGLLEFASSPEEKSFIKKAFKALCNGRGDWGSTRLSDTSDAGKYFDYYRETADDLLDVLKPAMIDAGPAYDIMKDLANTPMSLRRIEGASYEEIEEGMKKYIREVDSVIEEKVYTAVDLSLYTDCKSMEEWITLLVQDTREDDPSLDGERLARNIKNFVESAIECHEMAWNAKSGTLIRK
jgi:hypothetical protein